MLVLIPKKYYHPIRKYKDLFGYRFNIEMFLIFTDIFAWRKTFTQGGVFVSEGSEFVAMERQQEKGKRKEGNSHTYEQLHTSTAFVSSSCRAWWYYFHMNKK